MKFYHAHIYFQPNEFEFAKRLCDRASHEAMFIYRELYSEAIGPHPSGMIELHFHEPDFQSSRTWLDRHRQDLSVLIHEETGDDHRDHLENIEWLGKPLLIDFDFFDLILKHPELRVHQD